MDVAEFPLYEESDQETYTTTVHPGELLLIPPYWWHEVESLDDSISLTFWYKTPPLDLSKLVLPLPSTERVALSRNIERILQGLAGPSLHTMARALSLLLQELSSDEQCLPLCEYHTTHTKLKQLLRLLLQPSEVYPFLEDIFQGRYSRLL